MGDRIIEPELLDSLPEARARSSLADLERINAWFGGHRALLAAVSPLVGRTQRFNVLDAGAATGAMGRFLRRRYPEATVTSLDRRTQHLASAPEPRVAADAFHLPFRPASFDVVMCSLFLHHFDDADVSRLLSGLFRTARRGLAVVDLYRHPVAEWFLPATRHLLGWDEVTVHDGRRSVRAAFLPRELEALARDAGLPHPEVRLHLPWFRITLSVKRR